MTVTKQTTITADFLRKLISQFQEKPNIAAILGALLDEVQELEDAAIDVRDETTLDNSIGEQLDGIGRIVGAPRAGLGDDAYRLRLRAQILINLSSGTIPEIVAIVELLIANTFEPVEFFPAAFVIVFANALSSTDAATLAVFIATARPVAVGGSVEFTAVADADTFTFASGDIAEVSAVQGFSNDGGTSGGKYADALGA